MSKKPPVKRARLDSDEHDPDVLRAQLAASDNCEVYLEKAANLEPDENLNPQLLFAWAVLRCGGNLKNMSIITQVLKDAGHLGTEFVMKVLIELKHFAKKEIEIVKSIVEHLIGIRQQLQCLCCQIPQVLVTPHRTCICGSSFKNYDVSFSKVNLFDVGSKATNVLLARIYCHNCFRSNGPWCIDQHKRGKKSRKLVDRDPMRFYYQWKDARFVEASETQYFSKTICEQFATLLSHSWVSYQGFSEAFSELLHNFRVADNNEHNDNKAIYMNRTDLSKAFLEYETWLHLLEQNEKGTSDLDTISRQMDLNSFLKTMESNDKGVYMHKNTTKCTEVGCKWVAIVDGNWKLQYPLCMFQELKQGYLPSSRVPTTCSNEPKSRGAFCEKHTSIMVAKGWPSGRREFIEKVKSKAGKTKAVLDMISEIAQTTDVIESTPILDTDENDYQNNDINEQEIVAELVSELSDTEDEENTDEIETSNDLRVLRPVTRSMKKRMAIECVQDVLLENATLKDDDEGDKHSQLLKTSDLKLGGLAKCYKNIGTRKNITKWSRGHCFVVSPCGHVLRWQPLYGSESPSQVFVIMMEHLCQVLKDIPVHEWEKYCLIYDNICHVDDMIVARSELPTQTHDGKTLWAAPFNKAWLLIKKFIDRLHISNHKDSRCQTIYHPDNLASVHPELKVNTMRAEETFVWLSRFKKILCAMPKTHHHFVLHRLIVRRNNYTYWKRSSAGTGWQSTPIGPKVRSQYTT